MNPQSHRVSPINKLIQSKRSGRMNQGRVGPPMEANGKRDIEYCAAFLPVLGKSRTFHKTTSSSALGSKKPAPPEYSPLVCKPRSLSTRADER
jgi:hypothetical protein